MVELPPPDETRAIPAADVTGGASTGPVVSNRTYPVTVPDEDVNDFVVEVRASALRRARKQLKAITAFRPGWADAALAICGVALGGVLGAIASEVAFAGFRGLVFYVVCPVMVVGSGIAYLFLRRLAGQKLPAQLAEGILADIPDPSRTQQRGV